MRIGFTGSRDGMTGAQEKTLIEHLLGLPVLVVESHYGDCKGSDERFLWLTVQLGTGGVLHSHPATLSPGWDRRYRAYTKDRHPELGIVEYPALPPLVRNKIIVGSVDQMYATPHSPDPDAVSGTWATIRNAWKREVPIVVIGPDGEEITCSGSPSPSSARSS